MTHETSPDPDEDQSLAREPKGDDAEFRSLYEAQSAYVHGLAGREPDGPRARFRGRRNG